MDKYTATDSRVFISYSSSDREKVLTIWERIYSTLNYKCWIDLEGIEGGDDYITRIITAIEKSEVVLFMLSDNSIASENTKKEIKYASNTHKRVVPVIIDGGNLRGWFLFEFGSIDYIDISKPERFQKLIKNLTTWLSLSSVKAEPTKLIINHTQLEYNGHEYVDLGLPSGTLWATCNVGASTPSDYGDYFAWGETSPKSSYDFKNFKYRISGDSYKNVKFSKYVAESEYGEVDNKTRLEMQDDAARANWGGSWRMPTQEEWEELYDNCTWEWTTQGGHKGYKVTSKKNGNSIFLPAAGYYVGSSSDGVGTNGYYWSSSLSTVYSYGACGCYFDSSGVYPSFWPYRYGGHSVRPVSSSSQN